MNSFLGGFSFLIIYLYFVIPLAPIIYIFIKWRSYRDAASPDSQLGIKVILYYFKTISYHVFLASLVIILFALIKSKNNLIEVGLGLLISSTIIYVIHYILIQKLTNTIRYPLTARVYTGLNLIIVGLVGMISFTISLAILIDKGFSDIKFPLSCFVVYTIAWVFQTILFCKKGTIKKISPVQR